MGVSLFELGDPIVCCSRPGLTRAPPPIPMRCGYMSPPLQPVRRRVASRMTAFPAPSAQPPSLRYAHLEGSYGSMSSDRLSEPLKSRQATETAEERHAHP